ncbi:MAG: hypothetical protein E7187_00050 [Erysipelotrichaceae bacterium]|nr:hypothetical protein [Erysipelotrichaceae bacterium]
MSGNKGFIFLDTLIGMFIVMILVSLTMLMVSLKQNFSYDFREQEISDIWNDLSGNRIYYPEKPVETEEQLPQIEDTPLLN